MDLIPINMTCFFFVLKRDFLHFVMLNSNLISKHLTYIRLISFSTQAKNLYIFMQQIKPYEIPETAYCILIAFSCL